MKINLYYFEFNLGFLTQGLEGYIWTPNVEEINQAKKEHEMGMDMFFLPTAKKVYPFVPRHYSEFLDSSERADLREKAGIEDGDSDFEKLYKLGKLDYFNQEFVIKS